MPSLDTQIGYNALAIRYGLACEEEATSSFVSSRVREVVRTEYESGNRVVRYPLQYTFEPGLAHELEFSLRYEGVNLGILAALFEKTGPTDLQAWLKRQPNSRYARVAGFLYEWLTGTELDYTAPRGARTIPVLDPDRYYAPKGARNSRFGVVDNLPGTVALCPLVRRSAQLEKLLARNLAADIRTVVAQIEPELLERAVNYLYLSETRSSFAIEHDVPDQARAERFRRLLEQAGSAEHLDEQTLVTWQNAIVPEHRAEASFRTRQNWLSRPGKLGAGSIADYIPPAAADVAMMMAGIDAIARLAEKDSYPPLLAAACAAFGFVYVHPFYDGNGRIHRFLLHHILRRTHVTPAGIVVPVSAVMLKDIERYSRVLRAYSAPRMQHIEYRLDADTDTIEVRSGQSRWRYAYFDATAACEFVLDCLSLALDRELVSELQYLRSYDNAFTRVGSWLDAPQPELEKLIRYIVQNGGGLSHNKRSQFPKLSDAEVQRVEAIVRDAFAISAAAPAAQ